MKPEHLGRDIYVVRFDTLETFSEATRRVDGFYRYGNAFTYENEDGNKLIPESDTQFRMWYMNHEPRAKQTGSYRYDQDAKSVVLPVGMIESFEIAARGMGITPTKEEKNLSALADDLGQGQLIAINSCVSFPGQTYADMAIALYNSDNAFKEYINSMLGATIGLKERDDMLAYLQGPHREIAPYFATQQLIKEFEMFGELPATTGSLTHTNVSAVNMLIEDKVNEITSTFLNE